MKQQQGGKTMSKKLLPAEPADHIAVFQEKTIRRTWHNEEWWFAIVDVVAVLTDSTDVKQYIKKMRSRDPMLDANWGTTCTPLHLLAPDGKLRATNCANTEGLFRIIQSIPSPQAEPFKRWLAQVGYERVKEIENPELAMGRMQDLYEQKGYPKEWIDKRLRGIAVRQDLTDEWKERGVESSKEFAILTNEIMHGAFDLKVDEYKQVKSLARENLRDHMTDIELILTMLAEATTTKLHRDRDSQGMAPLKKDAKDGGAVAGRTRKDIEQQTGKTVISTENFKQLTGAEPKKLKKDED
jgi:prophage antirepressor-like protein